MRALLSMCEPARIHMHAVHRQHPRVMSIPCATKWSRSIIFQYGIVAPSHALHALRRKWSATSCFTRMPHALLPHAGLLRLHRGGHLRTAGLLAPDIADCLRGDTILHGKERGGLRRPPVLRKVDRDSVLWRDLAPASSQSEARVSCLLFWLVYSVLFA